MGKTDFEKPIFISRVEVGRLFQGLNKKTLANLGSNGIGPKFYRNGRKIFYRVSDIEDWLTQSPVLTSEVRP